MLSTLESRSRGATTSVEHPVSKLKPSAEGAEAPQPDFGRCALTDCRDDARPSRRFRPERVGRWLCLAGAALGALGLLDEIAGAGLWARLLPGEPPMPPSSALGLVLTGSAGALRHRQDAGRVRTTLSLLAALVALAIGIGTLAEYALAIDLHSDQLLARALPGAYLRRPSPLMALGLTQLAAAILLIDVRATARARPSEWLALSGWLTGFTALLGFVFHASVLYRVTRAPLIGVAPAAAVGLLLTSTGLLLARPASGLMREVTVPGPGGSLLRRLVPATVLGPALLGLAALQVLRALGVETPSMLSAVLAASMTVAGLLLLVTTAAPLTRAHETLELSHARIRTLLEQASDGIFVSDLEGRYTDVNSAGCRMLGLTREEIVGKTIVDLIPGDKVEQLEREKEQLLRGDGVLSEWVLRKKDGTWLPVEVSAKILPDGRWQGFVRDISERRRLEAALRASHDDLIRAQSVANVGSWRLDVRHDILQWSEESYRIFGVRPGTPMTYDAFLACVHPDDRAYVAREWTAALRGQPYDIEHRIVVDGAVRWVREKADLEFDENQVLVGGIGVTLHITERKQREEELRRMQERLDLALRGADLALWDWNVASGEVVFNQRWAEMRGYRPEEIKGHVDSWISGMHPEDWPRVQEALEEYFRGRCSEYESEHRVRTKSGEWIWILDRGKVFARNERGEPIRMLGTELDITSRKHSEEALRRSEAKAAGIVSISADAIISIDDQQRITLFNEGAEKIFGYTKAEALGAPLDILVPERFRAIHSQHVARFASGEATAGRMGDRGAPIFGLRKSGEEFPADAAISKLAVAGSRILTVALRDVTEQKRYEDEQRFLSEVGSVLSSTLELETTLTSIGQLTTRTVADFCIVYLTEEGGEVRRLKAVGRDPDHGWLCDALIRMPLDRTQAHEIWAELEANRSVLIEHLSPERVVALAQGEEHLRALRALDPRSVIVAPLFAHGKLVGAMALVSSAPARVYSPTDVRFAEQIAQRAAYAIDNAQLYAAAQRAIQSRDSVLGIVAHDLRNPLGTILIQAALLRRPGAEPERRSRKPAEVIERSGKRMNRIIQDLLDVTRMEEGRLSVEQVRVCARQVVSDSVEAQESLATAASLELELEVAPDLPEVWADRDRLLQIFENLIGNAVKFTEAGGIIRVGAAPRDGDVLFWVEDTGAGISAEHLPHVFDRFWQARRAERRGVGLGLPIVKGLVEAHGGRIWVESIFGRGTTFFFTIPTATRAEQ
jgi:PAS domain S-box-containing protein